VPPCPSRLRVGGCRTPVLEISVVTTPHFAISLLEAPTGVLRVCLSGDFDMSVGDALSQALVEAASRPGVSQVIVDLAHTLFFDSHAIAGLLAGYETATSAGRGFTVVNGRGIVQQVLDITGLSEVLCDQLAT
jgi:anti-anti-sigma factor